MLLALLTSLAAFAAPPASARASEVVGRSVEDRPIRATRIGDPEAPVTVLAVGSIHGSETAGHAVIRALRRRTPPAGIQLWLVTTGNPDGAAAGTRHNARSVDLNRNFPRRWRGGGRPGDVYYPGPSAASEPETRVLQRLVERIEPDVTVWYHQALALTNYSAGADRAVVRAYARRTRLPARELPRYRGTAADWQNHRADGTSAFVVELAAGRLGATRARRHARAVLAAGRDALARVGAAAARRPRIRWHPIPFGEERRKQMRAYARRHYDLDRVRLLEPKVIVEHFTATATFEPAFNTFAADEPDPELGERPGVCAHFIVDRDGTIHQLVRLRWMCRHTIGLNHTAFGIEHVGRSDAEVMDNRRQLAASLRLTRWLQERHGIATEDVIGHAESLSSPHHLERVERLRKRTHGDFAPKAMRRYRARLRARR